MPRRTDRASLGSALLWLGPALLLIGGVVVLPAVELVRASPGRLGWTLRSQTASRRWAEVWAGSSSSARWSDRIAAANSRRESSSRP